ncbi:MAG: SseB family protein [Clostridia bacterium]|nr:SseB family protein [Clostridia bacterium]
MSNGTMNFISNSDLEKYLKMRKDAHTEEEMKKIMGRIYGYIAEYSKLIHAFRYTIPPIVNEDGTKSLHPDAMVQLALIYSDTEEAYLPVYTSEEESKNRGNVNEFPELSQLSIEGFYDIVFSENSILQGIVINPYTDNLVLSRSKIENMMAIKSKRIIEKHHILEPDLKIPKVAAFPKNAMKEAIYFARKRAEIEALWIFEKQYRDKTDNTEHVATLIVVQDSLNGDDRENLYNDLKSVINASGVSLEFHVEALEMQREDFVRKDGVYPFYQKVNV